MGKLKLPASALLGEPLTEEEMKSILGGATTYSCSCKWYSNDAIWAKFSIEYITSESDCAKKCSEWCGKKNEAAKETVCIKTEYNYSVTTSTGSGSR